ncbi:MAG: hypothetical protein ACUVS2_01095 [Candidatus Flexifilum sp.]
MEFKTTMGGGDPDNWGPGGFSAAIFELMALLDQCLDEGEIDAFRRQVEALVLLIPPPLSLLSELEAALLNRRREFRQREFDARTHLLDLQERLHPYLNADQGHGGAEAASMTDSPSVYHQLIADARYTCDRAQRDLLLLEGALGVVSDWLRGLSTSAWWGSDPSQTFYGDINRGLPPLTQ